MNAIVEGQGNRIPLRSHQVECVNSVVRGLSDARGGDVRGNIVMATGTGKTFMAAEAARQLAPEGRVLVLVPTVSLLSQTVQAWRLAGFKGRMVAVCSQTDPALLEALGGETMVDYARCTTDPGQLARWTAVDGPVAVVATYASLTPQAGRDSAETGVQRRAGMLERAFMGVDGGTPMPVLDLLILDEAHRTSGDLGKSWAAALDQKRVPARRRLAMTATARLWEAPDGGGDAVQVASMDDVELYGPRLFELELMEAVEKSLLARWEIDVLEITDPGAGEEGLSEEEVRGRRLSALQAALLAHQDESGARSLLTFHNTTLAAMSFARALPETAAELHADDPARYPRRVSARWLSGEHTATHRAAELALFADGLDDDGFVADFQVLASCQVLAEGVDIRGRAGVDGVVFADARSSPVQVVQILGRALRQEPGEGKVARIIVPVFLAPGERPDAMMTSPAYKPLVQILQGLRAYDDRILQRLTAAARGASGVPSEVVRLDPQAPTDTGHGTGGQPGGQSARLELADGEAALGAGDGNAAEDEEDVDQGQAEQETADGPQETAGGAAVSRVPLLRFSQPRDPAAIARFLRTRVLQPDSEVWLTGYEQLRRWVAEYGEAAVPAEATVELDDESEYALGKWVQGQRTALAEGRLRPHRWDLLDELGMIWNVADARFQRGLIAARECYELHGTLAVPRQLTLDDFPVGRWLADLRRIAGESRAESRVAALSAIDPHWNPGWGLEWQRSWAALGQLLADEDGQTPEVPPGVMVNGIDVGLWLAQQLRGWHELDSGQQELLGRLGASPPDREKEGQDDVVVGLAELDAFGQGMAAARQHLAREGHLKVPRGHEERLEPADGGEVVVQKLGAWLNNQKARRARLSTDRRAELADLGLHWAK